MTTWRRTPVGVRCGGCGAWIQTGDPLAVVTLPHVEYKRFRGVCCAGAAPVDLPEAAMTVMVRRQQQRSFAEVVEALGDAPP